MKNLQNIKVELKKYANPDKAKSGAKFFKAASGEYGENDIFIGVSVPEQKKIATRFYKTLPLEEIENLLREPEHECRLTALFMLVLKYEKSKDLAEKEAVVMVYLKNTDRINNWDLVDSSAHKILGPYFQEKDKKVLYDFAGSANLWKQRIAIMTTFHFIRNKQFDDTLKMATMLLDHPHDLIHKAVGWMLREIGNRDFQVEYDFLKKRYNKMPRTMLRYAIEKFDEKMRLQFLKGTIK
jgi:3-methyladenine DNA glycosylase AlkD